MAEHPSKRQRTDSFDGFGDGDGDFGFDFPQDTPLEDPGGGFGDNAGFSFDAPPSSSANSSLPHTSDGVPNMNPASSQNDGFSFDDHAFGNSNSFIAGPGPGSGSNPASENDNLFGNANPSSTPVFQANLNNSSSQLPGGDSSSLGSSLLDSLNPNTNSQHPMPQSSLPNPPGGQAGGLYPQSSSFETMNQFGNSGGMFQGGNNSNTNGNNTMNIPGSFNSMPTSSMPPNTNNGNPFSTSSVGNFPFSSSAPSMHNAGPIPQQQPLPFNGGAPNSFSGPYPQQQQPPQMGYGGFNPNSAPSNMPMNTFLPSTNASNMPPQGGKPFLNGQTVGNNPGAGGSSFPPISNGPGFIPNNSQPGQPPTNRPLVPPSVPNNYLTTPQVIKVPTQEQGGLIPSAMPPQMNGGSGSQGRQPTTEQRRRAIQQQLLLLMHAHRCKLPPNTCTVTHCTTMKGVLLHMAQCKLGKMCQYPHCGSSRQIITHYTGCKNPQCPICASIKQQRQPDGSMPVVLPMGLTPGLPPQQLPGLPPSQLPGPHVPTIPPQGPGPVAQPMQPPASGPNVSLDERQRFIRDLEDATLSALPMDDREGRTPKVRELTANFEQKTYSSSLSADEYKSKMADKIKKAREGSIAKADALPDKKLRVFSPKELLHHLLPLLDRICKDEDSEAFKEPVDPVALNIPDYFQVIQHPMDLSTIREKLHNGQYAEPWAFCDDFRLMVDNACLYNKKTSKVYKCAQKILEEFESLVEPVMKRLGFCCGKRLHFSPYVLYCSGQPVCIIPRDTKYKALEHDGLTINFCQKCFDSQPDPFPLPEDNSVIKRKADFEDRTNTKLDPEPVNECSTCGRKQHEICSLWHKHIGRPFQCRDCLRLPGETAAEVLNPNFHARALQRTHLGDYLENKLRQFMKDKRRPEELFVRVISIAEKNVEVKEGIQQYYNGQAETMPAQIPYRTKALFVFERIENVDLCFFGMHVQEYGSDAPEPNRGRVYLAYLDSVHFFQPKELRTALYHELLVNYFAYCRDIGFTAVHIWACPPCPGDDYIFHCHPADQKVPKAKRLQDWYRDLLRYAQESGFVRDWHDLVQYAEIVNFQHARELPYFEGDFWPGIIEETIKTQDEPSKPGDGESEGKKGKKGALTKKSSAAKAPKKQNSKGSSSSSRQEDLADRLFAIMEKYRETFFVVQLQESYFVKKEIRDPDGIMYNDLMDGRDPFLSLARENHCEFSTLRRARHSSLVLLYHLHTHANATDFSCNECQKPLKGNEIRWHCKSAECPDFDLCNDCYEKVKHPHEMEKLGGASTSQSNDASADRRLKILKSYSDGFVHASRCFDPNCKVPNCLDCKKLFAHFKSCPNKASCHSCINIVKIIQIHAVRFCQSNQCQVPLCVQFKQKARSRENTMAARRRAMQMSMMTGQPATCALPPPSQSGPSMPPSSSGFPFVGQPPSSINMLPPSMPPSTGFELAQPPPQPMQLEQSRPSQPSNPLNGMTSNPQMNLLRQQAQPLIVNLQDIQKRLHSEMESYSKLKSENATKPNDPSLTERLKQKEEQIRILHVQKRDVFSKLPEPIQQYIKHHQMQQQQQQQQQPAQPPMQQPPGSLRPGPPAMMPPSNPQVGGPRPPFPNQLPPNPSMMPPQSQHQGPLPGGNMMGNPPVSNMMNQGGSNPGGGPLPFMPNSSQPGMSMSSSMPSIPLPNVSNPSQMNPGLMNPGFGPNSNNMNGLPPNGMQQHSLNNFNTNNNANANGNSNFGAFGPGGMGANISAPPSSNMNMNMNMGSSNQGSTNSLQGPFNPPPGGVGPGLNAFGGPPGFGVNGPPAPGSNQGGGPQENSRQELSKLATTLFQKMRELSPQQQQVRIQSFTPVEKEAWRMLVTHLNQKKQLQQQQQQQQQQQGNIPGQPQAVPPQPMQPVASQQSFMGAPQNNMMGGQQPATQGDRLESFADNL